MDGGQKYNCTSAFIGIVLLLLFKLLQQCLFATGFFGMQQTQVLVRFAIDPGCQGGPTGGGVAAALAVAVLWKRAQKTHRFKLNREFHFTDMRIVTRMELEEILKEQISAVKVPSSHLEIRLGLRYV